MGVSLPGGGGKRTLDFDLNLVPFIDLLSCCISFLLITAAWNQLARIETNQKVDQPGKSTMKDEKGRVNVQIDAGGYRILLPETDAFAPVPKKDGEFDRD